MANCADWDKLGKLDNLDKLDKLDKLTDEELMQSYLAGDITAYERLYSRHYARVKAYLAKRFQDQGLIEELTQEAFLKLHQNRDKFRKGELLLPWLFTIARNVALDTLKTAEQKVRQASLAENHLDQLEATTAEESVDLVELLGKLPEAQQRLLKLRYEQGWSFTEIAGELRVTEVNARKLMSRALQKLKVATLGR